MSVNIQTANGLKSLTGEKLTSSKVVSALGYTPANTNDLQKYLTITNATSTYASISYVDTKWDEAITIIQSNFVSKQQEATVNELGLVKISTDQQDLDGAQELDTSVPTVYAVQQYFTYGANLTAEYVLGIVEDAYLTKTDAGNTYALATHDHDSVYLKKTDVDDWIGDDQDIYESKADLVPSCKAVKDYLDTFYLTKTDVESTYATKEEVAELASSSVGSGTTTTLFNTLTYVGAIAVANETSNITITLNDNVQAGDKIRVYINGGSSYPQCQAAIIEFELYNPTSATLAGIGSVMSDTGASMGIISASVSSGLKITNQLKISIYCLTNTVYASGSNVYVSKVERVRFVSTTTYISGDNVAYGSGSAITNYEYGDVEGTAIDGDDLTYGGDS